MSKTRYYILVLPKLPNLAKGSQIQCCFNLFEQWYQSQHVERTVVVKDLTKEDKTVLTLIDVRVHEIHSHELSSAILEELNKWNTPTDILCSTIQTSIS